MQIFYQIKTDKVSLNKLTPGGDVNSISISVT